MSILALPYPPTINHYYVRSRFGGVTLGAKGREYRDAVRAIVMEKRPPSYGSRRLDGLAVGGQEYLASAAWNQGQTIFDIAACIFGMCRQFICVEAIHVADEVRWRFDIGAFRFQGLN